MKAKLHQYCEKAQWLWAVAALAFVLNPVLSRIYAAGESNSPAKPVLKDKTLVVWAAPATLDQGGGSALTIDDGQTHFDGIVFGELAPHRWMAGSDFFHRTRQDQQSWPEETEKSLVQIAIVYHGREVTLYRNGNLYARYNMANPPLEFGAYPVVLFGQRHLDVGNPKQSFKGRIKDARIYDQPLDQDTIRNLSPGKTSNSPSPWAWWSFPDEGLREKTGRFTEIKLIGKVRIEDGCLVLEGDGATVIASGYAPDSRRIAAPTQWSSASPVPDAVVSSTRLLRERFLADPYRPRYHFCVPEDMGQPGDPNGAFYHDGRYHLMYLYNRTGSGFCWGHISSIDLLHWRHHPDSIGPGNGDEGCFSGGAFVDDDGTAYLSYWMLWGAKGIGLAKSKDPFFDHWEKLASNPVIRSTEWGITEATDSTGNKFLYGSADPSNIWKKDGRYYMLTGNLLVLNKVGRLPTALPPEQGDRLYLLSSDNLKDWKYHHVFYERKPEWTEASEDNMCPSFLPLPSKADGGAPSSKHLLLFISHNKGCQYYVGDYREDKFYPNNHGRMSWVDNTYFAPEALIDGKGRQIMWAWLTDNPPGEKEKGWSGVYGLPRTLWLGEDGQLRQAPIKELQQLRLHPKSWNDLVCTNGETKPLQGIMGDSCELNLKIDPDSSSHCGVVVRASADNSEKTLLYYNATSKELVFDATQSGKNGRKIIERAPFALKPGESLRLRVFIDKSVVEIFANDRQAIGRRVYPSESNSSEIAIFAEGGQAKFNAIKAWEMAPSNPF